MPDITGYSVQLVVGAVVSASAIFAVAGVLIGRRLLKRFVREGHNDVVAPIFATAGVLYAVVLGFLVILIWTNFDAAHTRSNGEASTLAAMYRMTLGMPAGEQAAVRPLLRSYGENVVKVEWITQAGGEAAPEVDKALNAMYAEQANLSPDVASQPVNLEFLRSLNVLSVDRNQRILAGSEQLDPILWITLFLGQIITVGMTFLMYSERRLVHLIAATGLSVFIGMLLAVALVLDNPYAGQLGIATDAFDHAIATFDSIDKGGQ